MQDGEKEVSQHSNANIYRTASLACSKKKIKKLIMSHLI